MKAMNAAIDMKADAFSQTPAGTPPCKVFMVVRAITRLSANLFSGRLAEWHATAAVRGRDVAESLCVLAHPAGPSFRAAYATYHEEFISDPDKHKPDIAALPLTRRDRNFWPWVEDLCAPPARD